MQPGRHLPCGPQPAKSRNRTVSSTSPPALRAQLSPIQGIEQLHEGTRPSSPGIRPASPESRAGKEQSESQETLHPSRNPAKSRFQRANCERRQWTRQSAGSERFPGPVLPRGLSEHSSVDITQNTLRSAPGWRNQAAPGRIDRVIDSNARQFPDANYPFWEVCSLKNLQLPDSPFTTLARPTSGAALTVPRRTLRSAAAAMPRQPEQRLQK